MSNRSAARVLEVAALDALQRLGVAADDAADGVLGGELLLLDERLDLADQAGVLDEQGVGAEDGAVLLAEPVGDGLLLFAGGGGGGGQRLAQAGSSSGTAAGATVRWGMRNQSVSSTRAGPMATPGETGMPRLISMCGPESVGRGPQ